MDYENLKNAPEIKEVIPKNEIAFAFIKPHAIKDLPEIEKLLKESDFNTITIESVGERFSAAVYLISSFLFFWPIKFLFYCFALIFDKLIPKTLKLRQPCPIGYFVEANK